MSRQLISEEIIRIFNSVIERKKYYMTMSSSININFSKLIVDALQSILEIAQSFYSQSEIRSNQRMSQIEIDD